MRAIDMTAADMHDLIIENALLVDGTGVPARPGGVAVADGRIKAVGDSLGSARQRIDANGLTLSPGIIDTHTHYDAQITWDPMAGPSPLHGVTSAVIGNCGFTIAPCKPGDRDLIMRNLVRVEGMSLDAMREGIVWEFETIPEYLDMIERRGVGINVAAFAGHSSVRTYVMGESAPERAARPEEVMQMAGIVRDAMRAGSVGFATSTSPSHNNAAGGPMPSRLADEHELRSLVGAMGEGGRGLFMLTKGADTSVEFLESVAAATGRPVMIAALLHNSTQPDAVFDNLEQIANARARGHALHGQVSCCPLTVEFTLQAPYPFEGIESWAPAMKADALGFRSLLAAPEFRAAIKRDLEAPVAVRLFNGEWHKLSVVQAGQAGNRHLEGQTLAEIGEREAKHPLDAMLDLSLSEDLQTIFTATLLNSDEDAVGRLLGDANSSIALSDAGAHLTFFCDAGFGLRLLGYWVRERGLMTLEQGIAELTSRPADIFGIRDRGRIVPGAHADLMLFDPAVVDRSQNRRVFDLPSGAPRLVSDPVGMHGVWVNGTRVADENGYCLDGGSGHLPGAVLREFA